MSDEVSGKKLTDIIDVIYSCLYDATTVEPAAMPVTVEPIVEPAEWMKMDANFTNRREVIELSMEHIPQNENESNDEHVDRVCDHRGLWATFFGSLESDKSCSFLEHQKKMKCCVGERPKTLDWMHVKVSADNHAGLKEEIFKDAQSGTFSKDFEERDVYEWLGFIEECGMMSEVCSKMDETWVPVSFNKLQLIFLNAKGILYLLGFPRHGSLFHCYLFIP